MTLYGIHLRAMPPEVLKISVLPWFENPNSKLQPCHPGANELNENPNDQLDNAKYSFDIMNTIIVDQYIYMYDMDTHCYCYR